jgi:Flp pilus assembly protein CpaB
MRAITVEVNETSGVAGMLVPGCRVDVMSTLNGANKDDTVACTIVQDVLVQAVGQRLAPGPAASDRDGQAVRSVTLVVKPRDAEAIELASSMGRPRLVLRGPNDRADSRSDGVSFVELRGEDPGHVRTQVVTVAPPVNPVNPVTPVTPVTAVATTQPTTRPAVRRPSDPFAEDVRPSRTVNLIRGSTKTQVVFELPDKPDANGVFSKTSNEPVER